MIQLNALSKGFSDKKIFKKTSFDFLAGNCHGIIGLNGAGKTTLFNLFSSYLKPDEGNILFNNHPMVKADVLYLETNNYFYPYLTGMEYLDIFPETNSGFRLEELNTIFQLPLNQLVDSYSTGMKKKLALLAILKQERPIYIFDEPFNGLDLESNHVLELIIKNLKKKKKTIFVSSHILNPLEHLCDEFHYLDDGEFIRSFKSEDFTMLQEFVRKNISSRYEDIVDKSV
jgi:ABC-2 type transport system ATP-binding protein